VQPGTVSHYQGSDGGERFSERVTVTHATMTIQGVDATVVRDVLRRADGTLAEITHDWYAADNDGNVWYLGEATATYDKQGKVNSREGSWQAGVRGAVAGLIMPANPRPTNAYRQELSAGHAEDQAWIVASGVEGLVGQAHRLVGIAHRAGDAGRDIGWEHVGDLGAGRNECSAQPSDQLLGDPSGVGVAVHPNSARVASSTASGTTRWCPVACVSSAIGCRPCANARRPAEVEIESRRSSRCAHDPCLPGTDHWCGARQGATLTGEARRGTSLRRQRAQSSTRSGAAR
jgi:hypothetical protein